MVHRRAHRVDMECLAVRSIIQAAVRQVGKAPHWFKCSLGHLNQTNEKAGLCPAE
jgi:hypothetical protein